MKDALIYFFQLDKVEARAGYLFVGLCTAAYLVMVALLVALVP